MSRSFTLEAQREYARLSGDTNPMHVDAVAARRTQAGEIPVHGTHLLLWALESAAERGLPLRDVARIKARFARFVPLDQPVSLTMERRGGETSLRLRLGQNTVATVTLPDGARARATPAWNEPEIVLGPCHARDMETLPGLSGWAAGTVALDEISAAFPHAASGLGAQRLDALMQISRIVGMECPGLHSMTALIDVALTEGASGRRGIGFRCTGMDARFRQASLAVAGSGLEGHVTAFVRHPPVAPPSMAEVARHVGPAECEGQRVLVIGGSRGLGAVTAELVAAAGGEVAITYAMGETDARLLCDAIAAVRPQATLGSFHFDARRPVAPQLAALTGNFSQIYYFATPYLQRGGEEFSPQLLSDFARFYVDAFEELCEVAGRRWPGAVLFYPSCVEVANPPAGTAEYARAKEAGEALCERLACDMPSLALRWVRLPRVLTDLTATVVPVQTQSALEVMLPIVRSMTD